MTSRNNIYSAFVSFDKYKNMLPPTLSHSYRIQALLHPNGMNNHTHLLIVGVGGIGCELLKVISKSPIASVHILDLDTIEISNLNRQFLFKQHHKGMSKALVAKQSILKLNPSLNIEAHHMNIKDLPISFFKKFTFLILALDNIEARAYVNKVGIRLNIPIIDAGTLAYKGNVTSIISQVSKCYSCQPKNSNQKVFPVCTIRMRPEKPIHCIVWGKMLFEAIFGGENEDNEMKDLVDLNQLTDEFSIMQKLFQIDIDNIKNAKSDTDNKLSQIFAKNIRTVPTETLEENIKLPIIEQYLSHDKVQTLENNVKLFVQSFQRLLKQKSQLGSIVFEKDDDDIIFFISSAANLRMFCFSIQQQSFNQVKNMAGNIVPAIASTNSIVSGIEVIEMMKYIRGSIQQMRSYFIQNQSNKIMPLKLEKPLISCTVCSHKSLPVTIECNFLEFKLEKLVEIIMEQTTGLEQFSINQGSKQIYNSDEPKETLLVKSIFQICESYEVDLILTNEETSKNVCMIWLIHNEGLKSYQIINSQKLKVEIEQEAKVGYNIEKKVEDDSDDIILFEDQNSPQIEIIQSKKRSKPQESQEVQHDIKKRSNVQ